jgi:hypothetical protein
MTNTDGRISGYVERIVEEAKSWPRVGTGEHRFGGTAFTVGPREFGHVHRFGLVDVAFPRRVRDRLVEAGRTGPHHVYPDSGWTTLHVETADGVDDARWLLRLSYLLHANALKRTPGGRTELADVDVGAGLDELGVDDDLRAMVLDERPEAGRG